jgi:hypothetical protein
MRAPFSAVTLHIGVRFGMAVCFREEKAVASGRMTDEGNSVFIEFRREEIDRVIVWTEERASSIRICWRQRAAADNRSWARASRIARGIQVPLRALLPSPSGRGTEERLARSRLLSGEAFGPGSFQQLTVAMNAAVRHAGASPAHVSRLVRENEQQSFFEISPWAAGLALTVDPVWRRALGFGFLDRPDDLERGAAYDYRIVGRFRRCDIEEHLLGFHTVPLGTPLPHSLFLGEIRLEWSGTAEIAGYPPAPRRGVGHPFRKCLNVDGSVTLSFSRPQTRVVLEHEPGADPAWHFSASSTRHDAGERVLLDSKPLESDDEWITLAVSAFDDRLRVDCGGVSLEVDRRELREGRLALVGQGEASFGSLKVEGLEIYTFPFVTSRYRSFVDHISSFDGRVEIISPNVLGPGSTSETVRGSGRRRGPPSRRRCSRKRRRKRGRPCLELGLRSSGCRSPRIRTGCSLAGCPPLG